MKQAIVLSVLVFSTVSFSTIEVKAMGGKLKGEQHSFEFNESFIKHSLDSIKTYRDDPTTRNEISLPLTSKVASVPTSTHTQIIPVYAADGLVFVMRYDDVALRNPNLLLKDMALMTALALNSPSLKHNNSWFEGVISTETLRIVQNQHSLAEKMRNTLAGDLLSQVQLDQLALDIIKQTELNPDIIKKAKFSKSSSGLAPIIKEQVIQALEKQISELKKLSQAQLEQRQRQIQTEESRRKPLKQSDLKKLEALILSGQRKEVRKFIQTQLPWNEMRPTENKAWKLWLEALENPDPARASVALHAVKNGASKVVVGDKNVGLMSVDLMKQVPLLDKAPGLAEQLVKPALRKNLLAFTLNPEQLLHEALVEKSGVMAVKIDSRRLFPNFTSSSFTTMELVAAAVVFPDEVVKYQEAGLKNSAELQVFIDDVNTKTKLNFHDWKFAKNSSGLSLRGKYQRDANLFMKEVLDFNPQAISCGKVF